VAEAGFADFLIVFFFLLGAAGFAGSLVVGLVLETGAGLVELDRRWRTAPVGWDFILVVDFFAFFLIFSNGPSMLILSFFCTLEFSRYPSTTASNFHLPACFKFVIEMPASAIAVAADLRAK
jgi:hypothetical protein